MNEQPSVWLCFLTSDGSVEAAAFDDDGEVITAPLGSDGLPAWDDGAIADHRGAGGPAGYGLLLAALSSAEGNARSVGLDVRRVPTSIRS